MLTPLQQHCLRGIGIRRWQERSSITENADSIAHTATSTTHDAIDYSAIESSINQITIPLANSLEAKKPDIISTATEIKEPPKLDSWDAIIDGIHACQACELAEKCSQKVPGTGARQADLLIIGEGPAHDEDLRGEPFVGRSGQLLDKMLAAIGIQRRDVFITNIVKCRPPNNRAPKAEEAQQCRVFLDAQIKQIRPKVILSVGRGSAHNLLNNSQPIGKLIQQMHQLPGTDIPLKVTYHPAYLLLNPSDKATAWNDLKLLRQILQ